MLTPSTRQAFLDLRKTGIGGSEIASLLSEIVDTKYGCRRRLWYEKSNIARDYPDEDSAPMRLGRLLEDPICDLYAKRTGRRVETLERQTHPDFPEIGVNVDRLVHAPDREGPGVLECKATLTRNFFDFKRNGLPPDYLMQVQAGILTVSAALGIDIQWGSFVVGKSDDPKMIARAIEWHINTNAPVDLRVETPDEFDPSYIFWFDVPRNEDICQAILREGPAFWLTVGDPDFIPGRLEPDDPKCSRCAWRDTCHGSALMPSVEGEITVMPELAGLATEYLQRSAILKEAEELVDETKQVIMERLGDRQAVKVPIGDQLRPVYFRPQDGKPLYAQAVKDIGAQYKVMRERLIQIGEPAAELIPMPEDMVKKGKGSRPLLLQYLQPREKKEK